MTRKIEADTMTAAADLAREYAVATGLIVGAINGVLNAAEAAGWVYINLDDLKAAARPELDYIAEHGSPMANLLNLEYRLPEVSLGSDE